MRGMPCNIGHGVAYASTLRNATLQWPPLLSLTCMEMDRWDPRCDCTYVQLILALKTPDGCSYAVL